MQKERANLVVTVVGLVVTNFSFERVFERLPCSHSRLGHFTRVSGSQKKMCRGVGVPDMPLF